MIDVGAHIGLISLGICNNDKIKKIHCFECDHNIPRIDLYNFGLSDSHKICTITENTFNSGCNYIDTTYDNSVTSKYEYSWSVKDFFNTRHNQYFSLIPIDSIQNKFNDVSVIKIDVEGYEYNVLKGAKNLITKHKPVIIIEIGVDNIDRVHTLLNELGYQLYKTLLNENFIYLPIGSNMII